MFIFSKLHCKEVIFKLTVYIKNNVFIKKSIVYIISLTIKDFIYIIYSCTIYIFFKQYINSFIYNSIPSLIVAFVLVLLCGICLSGLTNKLFEHLVNKWKSNFWDKYVLATLIDLSIYYFNPLVCNNALCFIGYEYEKDNNNNYGIVKSTRNCLSWESNALSFNWQGSYSGDRIQRKIAEQAGKKASLTYHKIKRLEPIVAALDRDQSNSRNNALLHSFTEHIESSKEELCIYLKQENISGIIVDCTPNDVMSVVNRQLSGIFFFPDGY